MGGLGLQAWALALALTLLGPSSLPSPVQGCSKSFTRAVQQLAVSWAHSSTWALGRKPLQRCPIELSVARDMVYACVIQYGGYRPLVPPERFKCGWCDFYI